MAVTWEPADVVCEYVAPTKTKNSVRSIRAILVFIFFLPSYGLVFQNQLLVWTKYSISLKREELSLQDRDCGPPEKSKNYDVGKVFRVRVVCYTKLFSHVASALSFVR